MIKRCAGSITDRAHMRYYKIIYDNCILHQIYYNVLSSTCNQLHNYAKSIAVLTLHKFLQKRMTRVANQSPSLHVILKAIHAGNGCNCIGIYLAVVESPTFSQHAL